MPSNAAQIPHVCLTLPQIISLGIHAHLALDEIEPHWADIAPAQVSTLDRFTFLAVTDLALSYDFAGSHKNRDLWLLWRAMIASKDLTRDQAETLLSLPVRDRIQAAHLLQSEPALWVFRSDPDGRVAEAAWSTGPGPSTFDEMMAARTFDVSLLNAAEIAEMAQSPMSAARAAAALSPLLDPADRRRLARDRVNRVQVALADRGDLDEGDVTALLERGKSMTVKAVAMGIPSHGSFTIEHLVSVVSRPQVARTFRIGVVRSLPKQPPSVNAALVSAVASVGDPGWHALLLAWTGGARVRRAAREHANPALAWAVATNENATAEDLLALVGHPAVAVRARAVNHPNASDEVLVMGADDAAFEVRQAATQRLITLTES